MPQLVVALRRRVLRTVEQTASVAASTSTPEEAEGQALAGVTADDWAYKDVNDEHEEDEAHVAEAAELRPLLPTPRRSGRPSTEECLRHKRLRDRPVRTPDPPGPDAAR